MCTTGLNPKKVRSISRIDEILKKESFTGFMIGKTDNCERRKAEHENEGFLYFEKLVDCNDLDEANDLEKLLINYYKQNDKLLNEKPGGEGRYSKNKEYYIYVVFK